MKDEVEILVGVAGLGFVGGALAKSFESRGQSTICYDKYRDGGINELDDLLIADIIFLCLPTPYVEGHGFDTTALHQVCKFLSRAEFFGLVVIKSTVEPGTTEELSERYQLNMVHNPEFLTARTAFKDFDNQKHIVIGEYLLKNRVLSNGLNIPRGAGLGYLCQVYKMLYPDASISMCTSGESESMKLFCNNFYAVKVQMFNEFYLLCQRIGVDFDSVKDMMLRNDWINPMHTNVPGPDGNLSYGGACFPKDIKGLRDFMKRMSTPHEVIEATISERNKIRKD
jgi:nucleotide sugar dehydrogenase